MLIQLTLDVGSFILVPKVFLGKLINHARDFWKKLASFFLIFYFS